MRNSHGTIENRTRDLPVCSAVPEATSSPRNFVRGGNIYECIERCHDRCEGINVYPLCRPFPNCAPWDVKKSSWDTQNCGS